MGDIASEDLRRGIQSPTTRGIQSPTTRGIANEKKRRKEEKAKRKAALYAAARKRVTRLYANPQLSGNGVSMRPDRQYYDGDEDDEDDDGFKVSMRPGESDSDDNGSVSEP